MVSIDTFMSVCLTYLSVYFSVLCQSVFYHQSICPKSPSIQIAGSNMYFVHIYRQRDASSKANLIKITQFPQTQEITDSWHNLYARESHTLGLGNDGHPASMSD